MTDDSRALSAQETNVGAPHGAKRARQGEDDAAAVMTTGGGVELPTDIVGHKTFLDGKGGHYHEPLTRAEGDAIWAAAMAAKDERAKAMPDERTAINVLWGAYQRLRELGWREWVYMPKDGELVDLIEAGSTGIHQGYYSGEWPKGTVWICDEGDSWPSHPILFRRRPVAQATAPLQGNAESPSSSDLNATGAITRHPESNGHT